MVSAIRNSPLAQPSDMTELSGKATLVGGGTTGIGRATAMLLAQQGARVFIFGRHEAELTDALADIRATGGQADGILADQSRREDIVRVFQQADQYLGGLDILVN